MRINTSDAQPSPANVPRIESSGTKATREAADRTASAAETTVRAFRERPTTPAATVSVSNESRDLAGATVEMIGAKAEMKAGVKLLQTSDELTQATLSILDRRR
jgi:hypothetical protein